MNFLPDPLHPAVVHFPIVLVLLGTVVGLVAVFWRKQHLSLLAAAALTLGALGAWAAVETGESDGGLLEGNSPPQESLVESHENWAKRTLAASAVAAATAIASLALFRFPRVARGAAVAAALSAMVASYCIYETGHRGGTLVFRYGAGVNAASNPASLAGKGP